MLVLFAALLLGTAAFYAALVGAMAVGFWRVRHAAPAPSAPPAPFGPLPETPFVSVVIAARNEEADLPACLRSVLGSAYPANRFEVLVVDDFSTDGTADAVRLLQQTLRRPSHAAPAAGLLDEPSEAANASLRLFQMADVARNAAGHKKAALIHGIAQAQGDLIVTTDADCTAAPGWLPAMVEAFQPGTAFVSGPVRYRPGRTLFGRLQTLEFLALVTFGAGGIGLGRPNICNSANVAYRRDVYETLTAGAEANGTGDGLGAADDELLLQRIALETDWQERFCPDPAAVVDTDPAPTLRAFLAQRRRWASMNTRYPDAALIAALASLYGFHVLLLVGLFAVWLAPALWLPVGAALALKVGAEAALLVPATRHFDRPGLLRYLLPGQPLHLLYVVYIGAAGLLGDVHWKGRRIG